MRSVDHQSEQPSSSAMRPGIAISSSRVCRQALFGDGHHIRFCSGARIPRPLPSDGRTGSSRAATFGVDRGFDAAAHKGHLAFTPLGLIPECQQALEFLVAADRFL